MIIRYKRHLSWIAFALFLGAQVLLAQHDAEYGPEKHQHHGHDCEIQQLADHAKAPSLPLPPAIAIASVTIAQVETAFVAAKLTAWAYPPAQPRAPPISIA